MPTPARFRTGCIARLWDGTRFADPRARARMQADAEAFARDVDPELAYPEDLVVFRVTRFRPEPDGLPAVVPGRALLHDLTALVLRLSRRDPCDAAARGGALPAPDVAHVLGVSARTLARFRADGLVMHHVRDPSGRVRLACFPDSIDAFRSRAEGRLDRARRTTRLGSASRAALVDGALRILGNGSRRSLHALATELAPAAGCSVRTVRTVLESDQRVRTLVAPRETGLRAARLSRDSRVPRVRARDVRAAVAALRIEPLPVFALPDAAKAILAPAVVQAAFASAAFAVSSPELPAPAPPRISGRRGGAAEAALAVAYRFLAWRASEAARRFPAAPRAAELDAVVRDLEHAHGVKRSLVLCCLPAALVPCVQRLGRSWPGLPEPLRYRWATFAAAECARALEPDAPLAVDVAGLRPSLIAEHAVERAIARGGPEFAPPRGDGPEALAHALDACVPWTLPRAR